MIRWSRGRSPSVGRRQQGYWADLPTDCGSSAMSRWRWWVNKAGAATAPARRTQNSAADIPRHPGWRRNAWSVRYDNSPYEFLRQMPADHPYWDIYRHRRIIMCVWQGSWEDELLDSTRQMDALLKEKNIPAWIDYWGFDSAHGWAWRRRQ